MKRYLIILVSVIVIFLSGIAGFNWLVDPFDILNSPLIDGVNVHKTNTRDRITKVYKVNRIKPATITLGSSRGLNFPVKHEVYTHYPVLNLALTSGSGYEMFRMFQHAHAVNPLKAVIIGLDEAFSNGVYANFNEDRLAVDSDGHSNLKRYMQYWRDIYNSVLSIDAIRASLSTIKKQSKYSVKNYSSTDRQKRIESAGGHHQMFTSFEYAYLNDLKVSKECSLDTALPNDKAVQKKLNSLHYLRDMFEIAYRDNIHLKLFFSPVHARMQEIYCMNDSGQNFELFKYSVVILNEMVAEQYNQKPFLIIDFSGYNRITTEAVPVKNDKTTIMKWYWEGSHYSEATANLILDRLLRKTKNSRLDDFGVALFKSNIITHFKKQRILRIKYQQNHKEDITALQGIVIKNRENHTP